VKRHKPPRFLQERQRDQLLSVVDRPRDLAILSLYVYSGLRRNELRMLDREDIDFDERTILVRFGKRGKWRQLRLHALAEQALRGYLTARADALEPLFLSRHTERISLRQLNRVLDRYTSGLGWERLGLHALRHTFATTLLRKSKSLEIIRRALGHTSIATTSMYLHLTDDEMYSAVDEL
jgi:integrase/recombinase XerC